MTRPPTSPAEHDPPSPGPRVLTVSLHRVRRGRAFAFATEDLAPDPPRASRAAQMLALAHEFQRLVDSGEVPDRAALAVQVGLTRARVTQIMDLLLLAPDIQEAVVLGHLHVGTERRLRAALRTLVWDRQRRSLAAAVESSACAPAGVDRGSAAVTSPPSL